MKIIEKMRKERIGEIAINNQGSEMKIIEYESEKNVTIEFIKTNFITHGKYRDFKLGKIFNPLDKTVYGIGYIGIGKYKPTEINSKKTNIYNTWLNMFLRCYSPKYHLKEKTYKGCSVCEEWHNFQVFGKWYENNFYSIEEDKMQLDKDILIKGNKIYSPDTCIFVPKKINTLFVKRQNDRGEYPIGVYYKKDRNKFVAMCCNGTNKNNYLGYFTTPEEAFQAYKNYKETFIRETANTYKNRYTQFPKKLYCAMMNYQVEITD